MATITKLHSPIARIVRNKVSIMEDRIFACDITFDCSIVSTVESDMDEGVVKVYSSKLYDESLAAPTHDGEEVVLHLQQVLTSLRVHLLKYPSLCSITFSKMIIGKCILLNHTQH